VRRTRETDHANRRPARALLVIAVAAALVAAIGVGVYGLFLAPKPAEPAPGATAPPQPAPSATAALTSPAALADSEAFARWAASALFDWDTATMNPSDVTDKLMATADPTGEGEAAGLASDIGNYLPDPQTWAKLRGYGTRQWIEIESVTVPDAWDQAVVDAAPGQILPGATAHTITGTRRREGVWENQPATFAAPVSFTVFTACAPTFPECRLLRLSLPDEPLK
jgi:hypothetical protein